MRLFSLGECTNCKADRWVLGHATPELTEFSCMHCGRSHFVPLTPAEYKQLVKGEEA